MNLEERIEFKSPLRYWSDWLTLIALFFVIFLTFIVIGTKHPSVIFLLIAFGFAIFYGFRYLFSCTTVIEIKDNVLTVTQYNRTLNKSSILSLSTNLIRGFEINQVGRGMYALFLYDYSFKTYKYSLFNLKAEFTLKTFLTPHFTYLTHKNNPIFGSFGSAFGFALKKSGLFFTLSFIAIALFCYLNTSYGLWPSYVNYLFAISIGWILWLVLIRKPVKENHFRFGATYWLVNLFLYLSPLCLIPIFDRISLINETPLHLKNCLEIFKHPKSRVLLIKEVSYDPEAFIVSNYRIGGRNKNGTYPVTHALTTPLGEGEAINPNRLYSFWLLITYKQKLRKNSSFYQMISDFNAQSKVEFKSSLRNKPVFYTFIEPNKALQSLFLSTTLKTNRFWVLEPHWESISDMNKQKTNEVLLFLLLFLALNVVSCINIASYR